MTADAHTGSASAEPMGGGRVEAWHWWLLALACSGGAGWVVYNAWVCEDAFITFRVVDNAVNGYGLRWNVHERVQAYTNPLWMLLHIPFYALWPDIVQVTLMLSVICTFLGIAIVLHTFPRAPLMAAAILILPLAASRSFVNYATSGLEHPLAYLTFAAFGWTLVRARRDRFWFWCCLWVSLALVNRLDMIVFYLPPLAYLFFTRYRQICWRQSALGLLPIIAWLIFSLFYYGFLFPNTSYAKLDPSIPVGNYLRSGLSYLRDLFETDFLAGLWIAISLLLPLHWLWQARAGRSEAGIYLSIAAGLLCYVLYVISVGGNYVSGKFWALPVFAAAWLLYGATGRTASRILMVLAISLGMLRVISPDVTPAKILCPACFRNMEIKFAPYGRGVSLFSHLQVRRGWTQKVKTKIEQGLLPRPRVARENRQFQVIELGGIGRYGFLAGSTLTIIDYFGLADPLLARLPGASGRLERVGHIAREIPKGYAHALETGSLAKMDPFLAAYYEKLRLIVSGALWDSERLETVFRFNLGEYEPLRRRYLESLDRAPADVAPAEPAGPVD